MRRHRHRLRPPLQTLPSSSLPLSAPTERLHPGPDPQIARMDAFSALAAPAVAAAAQGGRDPTQLIAFFAQEMQLFFKHIQDSVTKYSETGEMPPSLFT